VGMVSDFWAVQPLLVLLVLLLLQLVVGHKAKHRIFKAALFKGQHR